MVMCRPRQNGHDSQNVKNGSQSGGPVFMPRRKPSAFAESLLAELREDVTPYDDLWLAPTGQ